MTEVLLFIVLVVLHYHFHSPIPAWLWGVAVGLLLCTPNVKVRLEKDE